MKMFKILKLNNWKLFGNYIFGTWKFIFLFSIFYFLFSTLVVNAAVLYLIPVSGSYNLNDTFLVEVRLDTEGEYINIVDVGLSFPSEILEVKDFSSGNSVLALWIEEPEINQNIGQFSFSGGIPGGYQGIDGLIGKIVFRTFGTQDSVEIKFQDNSRVLLNDGKGTEASLTTKGAVFNILAGAGGNENEWQAEIEKDKTLPEPFKIEISQEPTVFDGKYFIVFSTTDKQTGIDHYEVKEGSKKWIDATSPYVLKNQKLTSDIWVKAVDKAGNFWMETLEAPNKLERKWELIIFGLVLVLVIIILWIKRWIYDRAREKYK